MTASGDYLDIIFPKGNLSRLVNAGAVKMEEQYTVWVKKRIALWTGKDVK